MLSVQSACGFCALCAFHALLALLFAETDTHTVKLDGRDIGVEVGSWPNEEYFHYLNGHTLREIDGITTYTCWMPSVSHVRKMAA